MWRCSILLALDLLTAVSSLHGQAIVSGDTYAVTAWTSEARVPASLDTVFAMAQDSEGYLWLGTRTGLIRFDGSQFFPWGSHGESPLPGRSIRALVSARDGSLWITFADADGLTRVKDGRITSFTARDGLSGNAITALIEDKKGAIWAGGSGGLATFSTEQWRRVEAADGLPDADVQGIFEDREGGLWIGTSVGVFRRAAGSPTFDLLNRSITNVHSFAEDSRGDMWATDSARIVRQLTAAHEIEYKAGVPLPAASWRLVSDRHGTVWIAALGNGLLRVREDAGSGRTVLEAFSDRDRIRGSVQSLFRDRENNIWVGMRDGLIRVSESFVTTDTPLAGLTDEGVRALTVSADGTVWVATTYGVNRFSKERRQSYDVSQTMALHSDRAGRVWAATISGISRFNEREFVQVAPARLDRVSSMTTDGTGDLWLCSGGQGISRLQNNRLERFGGDSAVANKPCSSVSADRQGRLWIGFTTGGIARRDGTGWKLYGESDGLAGGSVNGILEDKHGTIWINTVSGVSRFENDRFITLTAKNGLPEKLERSIVEDDHGHLWLLVNAGAGIIRFNKSEIDHVAADPAYQIRYVLYDGSDGVPSVLPFWSPKAVRGGDGKLWFATGTGVAVVDVTKLPTERRPISPRVENVVVDGVANASSSLSRLPPRLSTLQINYGALSLSTGTKLRFRYMLEGANTDWVYAGVQRQASFARLPGGDYRFRVTATSDGLWNEPEAVWAFSLPPPFYQTFWFGAACAAILASAIWGYWVLSMRAMRNKYALVIAERVRVSRDIHDVLLQSLGAVGLELEVVASHLDSADRQAGANALQRLRRQVQNCVTEARQSIWELRTPGLETHDITEALRDLAENTNWGRPVQIDITSMGHARRRSPQTEEQLLRIAREAISNAVRHGNANHVEVAVTHRRNAVSLRVSDDGCGFQPESVPANRAHCGLAAMKERAEKVGGRFKVVSRHGAGTTIEAVVPLSSW
jgi:signal transduction histidine kinase/ligand-binding sensor domain-containing protein